MCAVARPFACSSPLSSGRRSTLAPEPNDRQTSPVNLFRFIPGYETSVYEAGREPIFVALLAFLICFVITRGYTRMARVRAAAACAVSTSITWWSASSSLSSPGR